MTKGITIVKDSQTGEPVSAIIDFNVWGTYWEDVYDSLIALACQNEETIPWEEYKKRQAEHDALRADKPYDNSDVSSPTIDDEWEMRWAGLNVREDRLDERERQLNWRENQLDQRAKDLDMREAAFTRKTSNIGRRGTG